MNNMTRTVLPADLGSGPKGLGDPNDRRLRKVEMEIKIPEIMRERARLEKCKVEAEAFATCGKAAGLLLTFKCRQEASLLKSCMEKWFKDEGFRKECTEQYLEARSAYRSTGKKAEMKMKHPATF